MSRWAIVVCVSAAMLRAVVALGAGVADTRHNLSATGPGTVKAGDVRELCVFCHTPHRAVPARALWNRDLEPVTYTLYESSTLEATLKQPTGASRLCLSCHDGTTALGNLRVRPRGARVSLGQLTGRASLGMDLSDDHPVSFVYDSALALRQGQLADPPALPAALALDKTGQLQCTTCHDPHEDRRRKFLRMDGRAGALCTACHRQRNWTDSSHATSPAAWRGGGPSPWPTSPYTTVVDNACENCHRPHAAPRPARLLSQPEERNVCLVCHNGSVAARNLEREFAKPSAHPVAATDWTHDPREDPSTMSRHVTCADCHNPHQAVSTDAAPPLTSGRLRGVRGLNIAGASVATAAYEYEVCFKCHGVRDQTTAGAVRSDNVRNVRLKLSPSNPSYHPVAAAGRNTAMGGFEAGWSTGSVLGCIDCHNNDEWTPTGSRPRGSHGSRFDPILERNYDTNDPSSESFQSYVLCYKCHNRDYLLGDRARTFPHRKHVVDARTPCAACHDAHGSRQSAGLINFMVRDRTGRTVVSASATQRRLEFVPLEPGRGQCYLLCHGSNHEPRSYP